MFDWLENGSKPSEVFKTEVSTSSAFPDTPTVPPQLPIRKPVVRDRGRVEITQTESLPAAFEALTLESVPPVPPRNAVQGNLTLDNRSIRSLEVENLKKEVNTTEGLKVQLTYSDATKVAYVEIKGSIWYVVEFNFFGY